ncbi:hypothetical protein Tco_0074080 [Tanacetum coccineum]
MISQQRRPLATWVLNYCVKRQVAFTLADYLNTDMIVGELLLLIYAYYTFNQFRWHESHSEIKKLSMMQSVVRIIILAMYSITGDDDQFAAFMFSRIIVYQQTYLGGAATAGMWLQPWRVFRDVPMLADLSLNTSDIFVESVESVESGSAWHLFGVLQMVA